jgi:hypothetical protein
VTTDLRLRKFVLTTHLITSIGWLGTAAAYGGLVIAALRSSDADEVRAAYLALGPLTWFAIVPFALGSLFTGLVESLCTRWGLMRHYWVIYKFVLTLFATTVLFVNTRTVAALSQAAAHTHGADVFGLKGQLIHASLGVLVLLLTTLLGVYKPKGMTRYGWRKHHAPGGAEA